MTKLIHSILLIVFLVLPIFMNGQSDLTSDESIKFSEIYLSTKSNDIEARSISIVSILEKYNVSAERYKAIINNQLQAKSDVLSENEKQLIKEIALKNKNLEEAKQKLLAAKCDEHGLSQERYNEILIRYKTDLFFQREMKPYLDSIIHGEK
jgi:hypothetical protein